MATTIHSICRHAGQEWNVARAASSAPVSVNGKAKTECSNLIISSTVFMRLAIAARLAPFSKILPPAHVALQANDTSALAEDRCARARGTRIASPDHRLS